MSDEPRWPRSRTRVRSRHAATRWDPDRPAEDLPSLGVTVVLTVMGLGLFAILAWLAPDVTAVLALALLVWSVGVEVTGNTVSTRLGSPGRRLLWLLLRPAYVLGFVVWAVLEALIELVLG
jgi:hypothetical protein